MLINQQNNKEAVISGTSGVGKSILACKFALKNSKSFPGGIYSIRVNEEKFENSKNFLAEIARELLADLGIKPDKEINDKQIIKNMKERFASREALLIFDNVGTDRIRNLFPGGECAIIVTTTKKGLLYQLTDDQKIELFLPNEVNSSVLREKLINFSLNLLKNLVGENRKREIEQKSSIAKKILDLIGYLPLAIKLISNSLEKDFQETDLDEFLKNLENEKSRFEHLSDEKEKNVKGSDVWYAFALAIKGFEQKAKKIFVCLGACAKTGFSLELISRIAEFDSPESAKTCLRKHLVSNYLVKESNGYFIPRHNLIHDFAKLLLEEEIAYEWIDISNSPNVDAVHVKNNHANYFVDLVNRDYFFPFDELDEKIQDKYKFKDLSNKTKTSYKDIIDKLNFDYGNLILAAEWLAEPENFNYDKDGISYRFILSKILENFFYQYREEKQFTKLVGKFYQTAEKEKTNHEYCKKYFHLKILNFDYCISKCKKYCNSKCEKVENLENVIDEVRETSDLSQKEKDELECISLTKLFWVHAKETKNFLEAEEYLKNVDKFLKKLKASYRYKNADFLSLFPEDINILSSRFYTLKAQQRKFNSDTQIWLEKARDFSHKINFSQCPNEMLLYMDMRFGQRGEIYLNLGKLLKHEEAIKAKIFFNKAEIYLIKTLKISQLLRHSHGKSIVLRNLGKTYGELITYEQDDYAQTEKFNQAKKYLLDSCIQDKQLNGDFIPNKSRPLRELLVLYVKHKRIDSSIELFFNELNLSIIIAKSAQSINKIKEYKDAQISFIIVVEKAIDKYNLNNKKWQMYSCKIILF